MGTQITRTFVESINKAAFLGTSTRTQLEVVSPLLTETFSVLPARGEGKAPWPDWTSVQEAHAEYLDIVVREAYLASQEHRAAKVAVSQAVRNRNQVRKGLAAHHRRTRMSIEAHYGEQALPEVGLAEPPDRRYLAFSVQCRDSIVRFRDPELPGKLGDPEEGQGPLDFESLAQGFEGALETYEKALDALTEAKKVRDGALVDKQKAERRLRSVYASIARIQEGYYRLAGLDELADRIRLTIPRSPQKVEEDQQDPPPPPEPGGDAGESDVPDTP
jgi:hypothetical protein